MGWLTRVSGLRPAGCNVREATCGIGREGRTDGWTDGCTERGSERGVHGWSDGGTDGWTDGRMDGNCDGLEGGSALSGSRVIAAAASVGYLTTADSTELRRSPHCGLAMQLLAVIVRIADSATQWNLLHAVIMATPMSHPPCLMSSQLIPSGSLHCRGPDPEGQMPAETFNAREVVTSFARKGFR